MATLSATYMHMMDTGYSTKVRQHQYQHILRTVHSQNQLGRFRRRTGTKYWVMRTRMLSTTCLRPLMELRSPYVTRQQLQNASLAAFLKQSSLFHVVQTRNCPLQDLSTEYPTTSYQ